MSARFAIYLAPAADTELWRFGTSWLGRDPETGERRTERLGLPPDLHAQITEAPARYGFHGTLKAPFRLSAEASPAQLDAAMQEFCAGRAAFDGPALRVGVIDGFLALIPDGDSTGLDGLAADCVRGFEAYRAPLTDADMARRNPGSLSPAHRANLERWGYPYVFESFRFHMTLTGRLDAETIGTVRPLLEAALQGAVAAPMRVSSVALYREDEPGSPFRLQARYPLDDAG